MNYPPQKALYIRHDLSRVGMRAMRFWEHCGCVGGPITPRAAGEQAFPLLYPAALGDPALGRSLLRGSFLVQPLHPVLLSILTGAEV